MQKFNVVLDTNIFRKNPSRSDLAFTALERLGKAGICQLHLPYVVEREFQTRQISLYQKELSASLAGLDSVIRKGLPTAELATVTELRDALNASETTVLSAVEAALPLWADSINAMRHPLTQSAAQAAMEAYFHGHPPLTTPKTRDDIPDAFIFQTIKDIAALDPTLIVVAEDGKIATAAEAIPGVVVHRSLLKMIESASIQSELLELDVMENMAHTATLLRDYESIYKEFSSQIEREGGEKLLSKTIHSHQIPDDNHEATIFSYGEAEDIQVDFTRFSYFGSGQFGLPFEFRMIVSVIYCIFKSDFYCLDEKKMPSISDHNDHYYKAEDERSVQVTGTLRISFPPETIKTLTLETVDENITIEINLIEGIEVEEE